MPAGNRSSAGSPTGSRHDSKTRQGPIAMMAARDSRAISAVEAHFGSGDFVEDQSRSGPRRTRTDPCAAKCSPLLRSELERCSTSTLTISRLRKGVVKISGQSRPRPARYCVTLQKPLAHHVERCIVRCGITGVYNLGRIRWRTLAGTFPRIGPQ